MASDPLDGQEYKMALARTRQAVAVHKAMQFNEQGNPARCFQPCSLCRCSIQSAYPVGKLVCEHLRDIACAGHHLRRVHWM